MILAGVRSLLIVGEHRPGILSGAFLLEVIEAIANLLEEILGGKRPAVGQGHERPVEREHIGVARMLVQIGSDQPLGLVEIAAMERRPHRLEPGDVRGAAAEEREGEPIDYLLYATLTSGTTRENRDYERSYRLTMELIDVRTGNYDKQSADLVKGYHHSRLSRWRATNPLSR